MMLTMAQASLVPLWIIAGYLALLLGLGVVSSRFFKGTAADYFVVSRSVGSFLLLMSVFGTTMTGFALVGSTGESFAKGIGVYGLMASWSGLIHSAVFFLIGIRLWAVGKRYGYVTQCEYFRDRFDSPALGYILFAILVLLLIPYLLVGVIASGRFMQATTAGMFPETFVMTLPNGNPHPLTGSLPLWLGSLVVCLVVLGYVFFGGLRGAVWANTFQTIVFMITGVVAFYLIAQKFGGMQAASAKLLESTSAERAARGSQIGQAQFFTYCFVPLSVGMFPHLFQHWLTARSARSFRLTVVAHPVFIAIVWMPCILIGMWAAGLFADGGLRLPKNPDGTPISNAVLGAVINQLVHSNVLSGLVGAGVLAAIMSSLDSQFMCIGTMFTNDIVLRTCGRDRFNDRQKVWISRVFILAIVGVTYGLAVYMMGDDRRSQSVFALGVWCFSGFASLFPLVFAAVYWRRTTRAGALASVLVAAAVWAVLFYRDIFAEKAPGSEDEKLILGMMPVTFIFAASAITLIVVSLISRPLSEATVRKFFDPDAGDRR